MSGRPKQPLKPARYIFTYFINGKNYDFNEMTKEQSEAARLDIALAMENARLQGTGYRAYIDRMPDLNALFPGDQKDAEKAVPENKRGL